VFSSTYEKEKYMADSPSLLLKCGETGTVLGVTYEGGLFWVCYKPMYDFWTKEELEWLYMQVKEIVRVHEGWPKDKKSQIVHIGVGALHICPVS
jgi:hypothetical protein